jgi:hypothetical protein
MSCGSDPRPETPAPPARRQAAKKQSINAERLIAAFIWCTCTLSSVDINDHELTAGCLIISPAALMQSSPFDHDGRAPPWQSGNIN